MLFDVVNAVIFSSSERDGEYSNPLPSMAAQSKFLAVRDLK
jgi:hypothetical protein